MRDIKKDTQATDGIVLPSLERGDSAVIRTRKAYMVNLSAGVGSWEVLVYEWRIKNVFYSPGGP